MCSGLWRALCATNHSTYPHRANFQTACAFLYAKLLIYCIISDEDKVIFSASMIGRITVEEIVHLLGIHSLS